jgi:VWFA-related protein
MQAHGATALRNALYVALKQFGRLAQQGGDVRRQAIAVLTDGQDTSSLISFEDVLDLARRSGVNIYAIGVRSEPLNPHERPHREQAESDFSMKTLANETGGLAFFPEAVQHLKNVYASIATELSNQYSIGYAPTDARADGRFHRITVKMPTRPELKPRARQGYTADAERPVGTALRISR